jgi:hypothetical protein
MTDEPKNANNLAAVLCAARPEIQNAKLDKTNPHFKSKYASLASILEAIAPLAEHGIAVMETVGYDEQGRFVLTTQLSHAASGEKVQCVFPLPENLDSQKTGSALTYARRYSLTTLCGISSDEFDDDGEATRGAKGSRKREVKSPPKVEPNKLATEFIGAIEKCQSTEDLKSWANIPAVKSDLGKMEDTQSALVREAYVTRQNDVAKDLSGAV